MHINFSKRLYVRVTWRNITRITHAAAHYHKSRIIHCIIIFSISRRLSFLVFFVILIIGAHCIHANARTILTLQAASHSSRCILFVCTEPQGLIAIIRHGRVSRGQRRGSVPGYPSGVSANIRERYVDCAKQSLGWRRLKKMTPKTTKKRSTRKRMRGNTKSGLFHRNKFHVSFFLSLQLFYSAIFFHRIIESWWVGINAWNFSFESLIIAEKKWTYVCETRLKITTLNKIFLIFFHHKFFVDFDVIGFVFENDRSIRRLKNIMTCPQSHV